MGSRVSFWRPGWYPDVEGAATLPPMPRVQGAPFASNAATAAAIAALAAICGALAVKSVQAATAIAILVLLLAVYGQSRRAGLYGLWSLWLLAPMLRRLLALVEGTPSADPLALLPFLATGLLALIEMRQSMMSREARITFELAAAGFLIGAPMGLIADPQACAFALVAYLAGLAAFVLGWGDGREGRLNLVKTLTYLLPPICIYGICQYFFPLTSWDTNWLETVNLASIGSPQENHIRIFATLNSPGTFALVVAIAIILGLGVRRAVTVSIPVTAILVTALALTFVRSAWLALALGVIIFVAASRSKSAGRIVGVIAVLLVGLVLVGGSNPTTRAFTERLTSLGDVGKDESAQARLSATNKLLPEAISKPIGAGVGQAGLAVTLGDSGGETDGSGIQTIDNGYLSLIYQCGLIGGLLILAAMARSVMTAVKALGVERGLLSRAAVASVLAGLVALLLGLAAVDILYGITGAFFWYMAGAAYAARA
jgi:putative inorganic carbon (HCO3(-)) transporter